MMRSSFECSGPWEHETSVLEPLSGFSGVCMTKHPNDMDVLPKLMAADDNLHAICIVRDPRSVVTSIHPKAPDCYAASFKFWKRCYEQMQLCLRAPRFIVAGYEDLIRDPDSVQCRISERFPFLVSTSQFSRFHASASPSSDAVLALKGVRPLSDSRIHAWKSHLPRIKEEVQRHPDLPDMLIQAGYEEDVSWMQMLDGIPSLRHEVWQESGLHLFKKLDQWQRRRRRLKKCLAQAKESGATSGPGGI